MLEPYPKETEAKMQAFHGSLPEKSRRLYAGVEALKLPRGGVSYAATLFDCSRETVLRGIRELEEGGDLGDGRGLGGGRKPLLEKHPDINGVFLSLIKEHTAGDPMDEAVKWTNLTCAELGQLLEGQGFKVSRNIVRKLLKKNGYVKRKALKKSPEGSLKTVTHSSPASGN